MIVIWQIIAMMVNIPELFPSVIDLLFKLLALFFSLEFYQSLGLTLFRGIVGFLVALILSTFMAIVSLHKPFLKSFFLPILVAIRSIPVISVVLIALLWLSPPQLPSFIAIITMFPILYQNILNGMEHTDVRMIEMAKVFRKNLVERYLYIYLPSAQKMIFAGISTALGFGWRAVIIGEVLAGPVHGLGTGLKKSQAYIDMPGILAWTVVAILVSLVFEYFIKIMEKKSLKKRIIYKEISKISNSPNTDYKIFTLNNMNLRFNNGIILKDFNFRFTNDKIYLLKTPSGSGKTSILKVIAGILKPDSGVCSFEKNYRISYSFQDLRLIPWLTIEENIAFASPGYPQPNLNFREKMQKITILLELAEHRKKFPYELSGGQQQRVALARALCCESEVLLLDEPLNGLDKLLKRKIIKIIENLTASYKPVIIWATHDDVEELLSSPTEMIDFIPDINTYHD